MYSFAAFTFSAACPHQRKLISQQLQDAGRGRWLVLHTCQRLECYTVDLSDISALPETPSSMVEGRDAVIRLARIAAGLDSRVLGELEILGQVRAAYKDLVASAGASRVPAIFQEILALGRRARKVSGIDQKLTSLSGLASRFLLDQLPEGSPVAVLGSGSLASACIRYLSKRGASPVRVASRCPEKALDLALSYGGFGWGLDHLDYLLSGVRGVLCATSAPHPILYARHLPVMDGRRVIIDLGVPPDCSTDCLDVPGLEMVGLRAIEALAEGNRHERLTRAHVAERLIIESPTPIP